MSVENAVEFLETAWKNRNMKDKVWDTKNLSEIMSLALESGYEFNEDEFYIAQLEIVDRYDIQLTEEMLQTAAGGISVGINCGQNCHDCHGGVEQL